MGAIVIRDMRRPRGCVLLGRLQAFLVGVWLVAALAGGLVLGDRIDRPRALAGRLDGLFRVGSVTEAGSVAGAFGIPAPAQSRDRSGLEVAYGRLPLPFEANRGQFQGRARYVARGGGYTLLLNDRSAVLHLTARRPTGMADRRAAVSVGLSGASLHPRVLVSPAAGPGQLSDWHRSVTLAHGCPDVCAGAISRRVAGGRCILLWKSGSSRI